jgi:hypothetical protein
MKKIVDKIIFTIKQDIDFQKSLLSNKKCRRKMKEFISCRINCLEDVLDKINKILEIENV